MKFMLPLNLTNFIRPFQVLSIAAMLLAIAPTAQAAPKMAQRVAMQDQPLCFVQLPGRTKNLDKLCGLGGTGKATDQNGVINLDIDVNGDGISDQLLEADQQRFDAQDATMKQFQAQAQRNEPNPIDINATIAKLNSQYTARLPYSSQVKQALAEDNRIIAQLNKLPQNDQKRRAALEAKQLQLYQKYSQDPSFIKVEQAQQKVYKEIERRGSAQWLFGKKS
jgi:hypothetical protein